MRITDLLAAGLVLSLLGPFGCMERASLPLQQTVGSDPALPAPRQGLIPTVKIATAQGWPDGGKPVAARPELGV